MDDTDHDSINLFLSNLVEKALFDLEAAYCIEVDTDDKSVVPTTYGRIASYYYIHHESVRKFKDNLTANSSLADLLSLMTSVEEYAQLPVRHNEDTVNSELAQKLPLPVKSHTFDSPHTKAHLLLQAYFSEQQLPSSDYYTDTKSVLDQAIRILQALLDVSADQGWLVTSLQVIHLVQMVIQAAWWDRSCLLTLPHVTNYHLYSFRTANRKLIETLPQLMDAVGGRYDRLHDMLQDELTKQQVDQIFTVLNQLPQIDVKISVKGWWAGSRTGEEVRPVSQGGLRNPDDAWIEVHADQEYVLNVNLSRINRLHKRDSKAHAPKFTKPKDEGWIIILGEVESREVIALKRVGYVKSKSNVSLSFYTPLMTGRVIYTLYLMSDCYLGLDQQYDVCLQVKPSSLEAQVNTELAGDFSDLDLSDAD